MIQLAPRQLAHVTIRCVPPHRWCTSLTQGVYVTGSQIRVFTDTHSRKSSNSEVQVSYTWLLPPRTALRPSLAWALLLPSDCTLFFCSAIWSVRECRWARSLGNVDFSFSTYFRFSAHFWSLWLDQEMCCSPAHRLFIRFLVYQGGIWALEGFTNPQDHTARR